MFFLQLFLILSNMKVFMVGESAKHRDNLVQHLPADVEVVTLPREASISDRFDEQIGQQDVLISLKYSRRGSKPPPFRMLHVPGAGLDGIDFHSLPDTAWVCNVYEHEIPIAEYVFAAMLNHEIGYANMQMEFKHSRWADLYRFRTPHGEMFGKTLGLVGYGRIGREVAKRAKAFGMKVLVANRSSIENGVEYIDEFNLMSNLGAVLSAADYVLIACPLAESTRGLIDRHALEKMKRHAVLINVSRAEIIDQQALYETLKNNRLGGAILDVWWKYPTNEHDNPEPSDYPFDSLPSVSCTPHSSAWTHDLSKRRYRLIAKNIQHLISGEPLENVVHQARTI